MFFKPKYLNQSKEKVIYSLSTAFCCGSYAVSDYLEEIYSSCAKRGRASGKGITCESIKFSIGIPDEVQKTCPDFSTEEAFAIVFGKTTYIYGGSERGLVYGMHTLKSLINSDKCYEGLLYDAPVCSERGYRVYLPGRENIPVFKKMIDYIVEYRYNSVVLEIGGAMEYKRHPEFKDKWIEFCDEVYADPKRAEVIQRRTYPWEKNSIHCENGDGQVLTQDECRELAEYCRSRGIEVIPEVPTMSHSDYICLAHPEIAERQEDAYPDTYCPNHPDTYKYVFDIIDEVVEVFGPKQIHIGHDECYAIGVCERCKSTDPVELYVGDIKKIKEYLDTKNVKTSMWAEKLLKAFTASGTPIGGNPCGGFKNGGQWFNPPLWKCRDLLPQDMKYVHWYWEFGDHHDRVYHDREYEMHFGNLSAIFINNWKKRIGWGAKGGWVSNWGSFEEEYMQRNKQYFDLISGAYAFWNDDFDSSKKEKLLKITFKEAYKHKWENEKNVIKIRHRTKENIPHEYFWCGVFIEDGKYLLGNYEVEYADGTKALLPVKYGTNIGACTMPSYPLSRELFQLAGSVLPIGENGDFFYECKYKNPNPKSKIMGIKYVPIKQEFTVEYEVK